MSTGAGAGAGVDVTGAALDGAASPIAACGMHNAMHAKLQQAAAAACVRNSIIILFMTAPCSTPYESELDCGPLHAFDHFDFVFVRLRRPGATLDVFDRSNGPLYGSDLQQIVFASAARSRNFVIELIP